MLSCDARPAPGDDGYPDVPHFLEPHRTVGLAQDSVHNVGGSTITFDRDGVLRRIAMRDRLLIDSGSITVTEGNSVDQMSVAKHPILIERGSFFGRMSGNITLANHGNEDAALEETWEAFDSSPRGVMYSRLICKNSGTYGMKFRMVVPRGYDSLLVKSAAGIRSYTASQLPVTLLINGTESFFQCVSSLRKDGVGIFFHPADPELRRWFKDDYIVAGHLKRDVSLAVNPDGTIVVQIEIEPVKLEKGETVDQNFTVVDLGMSDNRITDYISPSTVDYYGRYNPVEGYSTHWYGKKNGFDQVHDDGFTWGFSTYARPFMEYFLHLNADSLHGYFKEEMMRHLAYFLERSNDYGLLPFTIIPIYLVNQTKEVDKIGTDFMFAQAGVGDIEFAREFVPSLPPDEATRVFGKLSRLKTLFDPANRLSWTLTLPSGGYWFEYSNLWKSEGYINYIINTHVTALRIAYNMRALAQRLGQSSDVDFWNDIVRKGTDGLMWYVGDPKNWGKAQNGNRELNYKIGQPPHGEYQKTITEDLTDVLKAGLMDYRRDEIVRALSLK